MNRDPINLLGDIHGAIGSIPNAKGQILAIRNIVLTPEERVLADKARGCVTNDDYEISLRKLAVIIGTAGYCAPELLWKNVIVPIANLVLTQDEIAAINAYNDKAYKVCEDKVEYEAKSNK